MWLRCTEVSYALATDITVQRQVMSADKLTEKLSTLTVSNKASSPRRISQRQREDHKSPDFRHLPLTVNKYVDIKAGPSPRSDQLDRRDEWQENYKHFKKGVGRNTEDTRMLRRGFANPTGQVFDVLTNFLSMDFYAEEESKTIYLYEVNGIDDSATRPKKRVLMEAMIEQCPLLADQRGFFVSDDKKKIISYKDLSEYDHGEYGIADEGDILASISVDNYDARSPDSKPQKTTLRLNYVKSFTYDDLTKFVEGSTHSVSFKDDGLVEAINIIMNKAIQSNSEKSSFTLGTNKVFSKAGQRPLGSESKFAGRGYNFSYRSGMGYHLLNVNTSTSVFHEPISVTRYLNSGNRRERMKDLQGARVWLNFSRTQPKDADRWLDDRGRRTKTITSFSDKNAGDQIAYDDVTVFKHMRSKYGTRSNGNANSVCVNLGGSEKGKELWFLAEDLIILPYQQFRGDLSAEVTSELIKQACRKPELNVSLVAKEFVSFLGIQNITEDTLDEMPQLLQDFGINVYPELISVPAYLAKAPIVNYSDQTTTPHDGKWMLTDQKFVSSGSFGGPAYFLIPEYEMRHLEQLNDYLGSFHDHYKSNGIKGLDNFDELEESNHSMLSDFSQPTFKTALTKAQNRNAALVVLLLPQKNKIYLKHYATFKKLCDQQFGIQSLCLCEHKAVTCFKGANTREDVSERHHFAGYVRNVAMKLNVRLGHSNHIAKGLHEQLPNANGERVMIIGADVVHPGGKSHPGTPSIAAVVASFDSNMINYRGSARYQQGREEIILGMKEMALERIEAYKAKNGGNLPSNILYYRDGVDEGSFGRLINEEMEDIRRAWNDASKNTDQANRHVKITMLVVTKRHNTRIYPKDGGPNIPNGNCLPGTIIDSGITMPYHFDFYLLSQNSIQGTGRPAHYIVLRNEMGFSADQIHNFTNMLCYTYARSTTSVSYAPPAYYADHLCERVKQYLRHLYDGEGKYEKEKEVLNEVKRVWKEGGREGGNPWNAALDDTMFWM
ncbi:Protein argonaute 18 [Pseudocercospora fuligena]|uniref:Protein argonaute 18 n=1 Tax=Pseudocercospora fuligena TaxID=685502 RepID=A0A8H6RUE4_9PEZI|nr:Protein argonaute 18 [Pseudocercospora fuligena]